jgi:hypothetical protein
MPLAAEDVSVRYDATLDASGFGTFSWLDVEKRMKDHPLAVGSPLDRAIRGAIEAELAKNGLRALESGGDGDFRLRYHAALTDSIEGSFARQSMGGNVIVEGTGDLMYQRSFQVGTLVLEVVHPSEERVLWLGAGRMTVKRERPLEDGPELRKMAGKLAAKIARKFPPRG